MLQGRWRAKGPSPPADRINKHRNALPTAWSCRRHARRSRRMRSRCHGCASLRWRVARLPGPCAILHWKRTGERQRARCCHGFRRRRAYSSRRGFRSMTEYSCLHWRSAHGSGRCIPRHCFRKTNRLNCSGWYIRLGCGWSHRSRGNGSPWRCACQSMKLGCCSPTARWCGRRCARG